MRQFIAARTGILFRPSDEDKFTAAVTARMRELRLRTETEYRAFLERPGSESRAEWAYLIEHLVPGESYFFRDRGQMDLIETVILPEIIKRQRQSGRMSLRIWSAGCSTGEEPYSLAALVYSVLPDLRDWQVRVLGTDMNEDALERARTGLFGDWSFRQVPVARRDRFFRPVSGAWQILPEIQALVDFQQHDLYTADYPERDGSIRDFDLIVCRNVFIYLQPTVISTIVARFERSLVPDGYLVTGHGELAEARPTGLVTRAFPATILYQRSAVATIREVPAEEVGVAAVRPLARHTQRRPPVPPPSRMPPAPVRSWESEHTATVNGDSLVLIRQLLTRGQYSCAVMELQNYLSRNAGDVEAEYLLARAYANLGQHEQASMVLNEILQRDPFGVRGYFLLAQISEEQGDQMRAMELLKRSIYLDPNYMPGYLELGLLYDHAGDRVRASRMLVSALELLKLLAADTEIEEYNGQTAECLIERVSQSLTL